MKRSINKTIEALRNYKSRNVTYIEADGSPAESITLSIAKNLLSKGFIIQPITPLLTIGKSHISRFIRSLDKAVKDTYV